MEKNLLIVFVKNILLGKVKTRLAKSIGNQSAFEVYKHLVKITERETSKMKDCDVHIYFSDVVIDEKWSNHQKFTQKGADLGEKMMNAFEYGFKLGYENIIGVGSDLPDLTAEIMHEGLQDLQSNDTVFGPSEDGGYYLIGMNKLHRCIFENKPWSTDVLLKLTKEELHQKGFSVGTLKTLNDVDTIADLKASSIAKHFEVLLQEN